MASRKISELPAATALTGAEIVPVVQGGVTKKATVDDLPISAATAEALEELALSLGSSGLPLGLTGAVAPTRYVGGTASVAPTTGTFAVGDYVVAQAGSIFVCTVAGTPGTWMQAGGGGSVPDADASTKGKVRLTGDFGGTADSPTVPGLAAKADLVGGVVPSSQIPAIATGQTTTVASQAAMLAQTGAQVQPGDVTIRSDLSGRRFLLGAANPSVLGNWISLETPDGVSSVNGQQGAVVLAKGDIGLPNADNTSDVNKPTSSATQAALDLKADASASILKALVDAKGDLLVGTAADTIARLPVGSSTNQFLATDPTTASGLRWTDPPDRPAHRAFIDADSEFWGSVADIVGLYIASFYASGAAHTVTFVGDVKESTNWTITIVDVDTGTVIAKDTGTTTRRAILKAFVPPGKETASYKVRAVANSGANGRVAATFDNQATLEVTF